ncbi:MAG TPA: metal ABC transporter permease [Burkholderiaceae bacterium]|nr:metal ABC transporter permease [Burkholderiaceae bacterium]
MSDWPLLLTPALAGVLVLLSHVPLGRQVLRRGIVFIDLAIAQVAALGVLVVGSLGETAHFPGLSTIAGAAAALAGAGLVAWLSRRWPDHREALIGLVYVTGAVLALLWASTDHRGAHLLASMLSGDVLWVTWPQLVPLALATAAFLAVHLRRPDIWFDGRAFYPAFALLVSLSVPLLGIYLVFATLIVPALAMTARAPSTPNREPAASTFTAVLLGVAGYLLGLLASLWADLPSGPSVVIALVVLGAGTGLVRSLFAGGAGQA